MKKTTKVLLLFIIGGWLMGNDFDFPRDASVKVMYQIRGNGSWTNGNTILRGVFTESMAKNQIAVKHPCMDVRILGIEYGGRRIFQVKYQYRRPQEKSWSTGATSLQNVLTESMAVNQLSVKHPNDEIRILSLIEK